jgi:putative phosphoribosyl transferase
MFEDRKDAGQKLGIALEAYRGTDAVVLAIPRGGVEVGYYIAEYLHLPFSVVIVRKLPFPDNPEAGFGAIAEDGSVYFIKRYSRALPQKMVKSIIEQQKEEVKRRIEVFRGTKPLPKVSGKSVIVVDDGIAMGSTTQAAVMMCRNKKAGKVIAAAPVASPSAAKELERTADEVVILERPAIFFAVAEFYKNWYDVPDEEVLGFIKKAESLNRT